MKTLNCRNCDYFLILLFTFCTASVQAVRVTNITGHAFVIGNISPNQARLEALNDAKLNALKAAGIPENISSYQSLQTTQVNNENNQSFEAHIQSAMRGTVTFDSIIQEGMITDSNSNVVYQVTINAEVQQYTSPPVVQQQISPKTTAIAYPLCTGPQNIAKTYYNGDSYTGGFANGERNGYGTYRWANGSEYVGYFINGKRNGAGVYYCSHGKVQSGYWTNGVLTQSHNFANDQATCSSNKSNAYTATTRTAQATQNTFVAPSPQQKLIQDQNNFSQEVEAKQQKQ